MTHKLEDEIRTALLPGAPDDDTRTAWARAALDSRPVHQSRRPHLLGPALAAAIVLAVLFWSREKEPEPAAPPQVHSEENDDDAARRLKSTSVAEQRVANASFLAQAEKRGSLNNVRKGNWVIVVGGDSLKIANTLEEAIKWADKLYPEAKHRFLFPIMNDMARGDVIVDRSPIALASAGSWFFQSVGLEAKGLKEIELDVGGKTLTFRVDHESSAPLILPAGVHFPRFEIPGRMVLEDMDRSWRTFRRYFVRVRSKAFKIDEWTEVVGAESADRYAPGNWMAVRLGGHVFHALRRDPKEQAAKESKPLLVLRFVKGSTSYLDTLFDGVEIEGFAQRAVPLAKKTVLQRYDAKGKLVKELALPDSGEETSKALLRFLR